MLLLIAFAFLVVSAQNDLCAKARRQWAEIADATARGVLINDPNATPEENKATRRRFRVLHDTIKECDRLEPISGASSPRSPLYRRPYNGRRNEIRKRNGEIQWAVRDSRGRFRDIQQRGRALAMDRRRSHLVTADRED